MSLPSVLTAAGPLASGLFSLIDDLFTSPEEKAAAALKLMELEQSGQLAQISVNREEAKHTSLFVAGWRPFIGWTCGLAFTWTFLVFPLLQFGMYAFGVQENIALLPSLDLSQMMPVLLGMLGLGAMRTYERSSGVERNTWDSPAEPEEHTIDRRANN